jgi:hypothetical protein
MADGTVSPSDIGSAIGAVKGYTVMRSILVPLGIGAVVFMGGIRHAVFPAAHAHPAVIHVAAYTASTGSTPALHQATTTIQGVETNDGADTGPHVQQGDQSGPDIPVDVTDSSDGEQSSGPDGDSTQIQQ